MIDEQLVARVEKAVRAAADDEVMPRWRRLAAHEVTVKAGPHDLVTVADRAAERRLTEELVRLLALGATEVADLRGTHGPGTGWVVLADPEGNEFCILRNDEERAAVPG